jgi:putative glutamine amidotransferase
VKVVAVSQRVDVLPERGETRDALDQDLVIWLRAAGYIAYPLPNAFHTDTEICAWLDRLVPCGLVLSGGNDIGAVARRDFTEETMIQGSSDFRVGHGSRV